jgi:hypothetical protein
MSAGSSIKGSNEDRCTCYAEFVHSTHAIVNILRVWKARRNPRASGANKTFLDHRSGIGQDLQEWGCDQTRIRGHQGGVEQFRCRGNEPVSRIPVVEREPFAFNCDGVRDRCLAQRRSRQRIGDPLLCVIGDAQPLLAEKDEDLPNADRRKPQLMIGIAKRGADFRSEAARVS